MASRRRGTFSGLDEYRLNNVRLTGRELGRGSYAAVTELEYLGLKCAGKKLHDVLSEQQVNYDVRHFEEECHLLSTIRHPNVVQFLGVYFQEQVRIPILVMEFLPTNLSSCIDQYGILPKEINYSILHDVSLGLNYLHSQIPPIIHRDLSSNNVLLTDDMTAKISDLGVARILNLTPLQISRMTQTPGTPAYMPPEAMVLNPKYDTSIDVFSLGIMMIHLFSAKWPIPQCEPIRIESRKMIPVSEAERREEYLHDIGQDHPLMDLILRCINNDPQQRGSASEIVKKLNDTMLQFPPSFANKVEMLAFLKKTENKKSTLTKELELKTDKSKTEREALKQIEEQVNRLTQAYLDVETRGKLACSLNLKQLKLQADSLKSQKNAVVSVIRTLSEENEILRTALEKDSSVISALSEQLDEARTFLTTRKQPFHATLSWKECAELPISISRGQAVVINNTVYVGSFTAYNESDETTIFCYDLSRNEWSSLPALSVVRFGLGQLGEKLIAVGGRRSNDGKPTKDIFTFDEKNRRWKQSIPPMPTARVLPSVIGHQPLLVVAGGVHPTDVLSDRVEVFNVNTLQWSLSHSLPVSCQNSSVIAGPQGTYFTMGGFRGTTPLNHAGSNQVTSFSIDQLLQNMLQPNQLSIDELISPFSSVPHTPTFEPAPAMLFNSLLAVGGRNAREEPRDKVFMFSDNSWREIATMPAAKCQVMTASLSETEFMIIGGCGLDGDRTKTVYRAMLDVVCV